LVRWFVKNVIAQLANTQTHPSVRLALEQGRLNLHGWVYDSETGSVDALDGKFRRTNRSESAEKPQCPACAGHFVVSAFDRRTH